MRIVLDANIYVSSLISDKGHPAQIIRWWLDGEYDVLITRPIIDEIVRITGYERIQNKYAQVGKRRLEFTALILEPAVWIEADETIDLVEADESDNRYVECAVSDHAQYIVTGDEHLLDLSEYQGIRIIRPAAFVTLYKGGYV